MDKVESAGDPNEAWPYATSLAGVAPVDLLHWRNRLLDDAVLMAGLVCARVESLENVNPSVLCCHQIRS